MYLLVTVIHFGLAKAVRVESEWHKRKSSPVNIMLKHAYAYIERRHHNGHSSDQVMI